MRSEDSMGRRRRMSAEEIRIHERVVDLFNKYSDTEALINAIVRFVDHEKFQSKTDGTMLAIEKIKEKFGINDE